MALAGLSLILTRRSGQGDTEHHRDQIDRGVDEKCQDQPPRDRSAAMLRLVLKARQTSSSQNCRAMPPTDRQSVSASLPAAIAELTEKRSAVIVADAVCHTDSEKKASASR